LERSEKEIAQIIKRKIEAIKDVKDCHQVTVRLSGKRLDVNMHVLLDSNLRFEDVHRITSLIEDNTRRIAPNARVTVQTEPLEYSRPNLVEVVKKIAEAVPASRGVHDIHIQRINGKICVDLHVEVSANMTVKDAHAVSDQIEKQLRAARPDISEVTVHIDSALDQVSRELEGNENELRWYIEHVTKRFVEIKAVHGVKMRRIKGKIHLVLRCHFEPDTSIEHAHEISSRLENVIRNAFPDVIRIDIHQEPD
jgi:divalent metal cation (Fe/Co/Zn/Cd) transporter